jgi:hypothetical protein
VGELVTLQEEYVASERCVSRLFESRDAHEHSEGCAYSIGGAL